MAVMYKQQCANFKPVSSVHCRYFLMSCEAFFGMGGIGLRGKEWEENKLVGNLKEQGRGGV